MANEANKNGIFEIGLTAGGTYESAFGAVDAKGAKEMVREQAKKLREQGKALTGSARYRWGLLNTGQRWTRVELKF
jgi:hypothetical protein